MRSNRLPPNASRSRIYRHQVRSFGGCAANGLLEDLWKPKRGHSAGETCAWPPGAVRGRNAGHWMVCGKGPWCAARVLYSQRQPHNLDYLTQIRTPEAPPGRPDEIADRLME
jgi:hypothetical protein